MIISLISSKKIIPSETNPRKTFWKDEADELRSSIAQLGLIHPLTVREHPTVKGAYELICGERRFRALTANANGSSVDVHCVVRDLNDQQVLDLQFTENLQRASVPPLEESEALHFYMKKKGMSGHDLSVRLGRSANYIYQRLRLVRLTDGFKKMLHSKKIAVSSAIYIASFPNYVQDAVYETIDVENNVIPTLNAIKAMIRNRFMTFLKQAIFDTSNENLINKRGSCHTCNFNTASNTSLFPQTEDRARCMDISCFSTKKETHTTNIVRTFRDEHPKGVFISTEVTRSTFLNNEYNVLYADEYSFTTQNTHRSVVALVVNPEAESDFLTTRFVEPKPKGVEQQSLEFGDRSTDEDDPNETGNVVLKSFSEQKAYTEKDVLKPFYEKTVEGTDLMQRWILFGYARQNQNVFIKEYEILMNTTIQEDLTYSEKLETVFYCIFNAKVDANKIAELTKKMVYNTLNPTEPYAVRFMDMIKNRYGN